jgi:arylformamidase
VSVPPRQFFDITLPLSNHTLVFPGDSPPDIQRASDLKQGASLTASTFSMGCHVGTHVDAPGHFLSQGMMVDELPLESFYGPALVVGQEGKQVVEKADVEKKIIPPHLHIFFKTDNGALLNGKVFSKERCTLSSQAAHYLTTLNPLSIGWDYYSLDPSTNLETFSAHTILAKANIPVFVCLNLKAIAEGLYGFSGFPLRLENVEGAPVRAILILQEEGE